MSEKVVDSILSRKNNVLGASIAIIYKDSVRYYPYGYADRNKTKKVDSSTVFEVGGVTKAFTGLLLADAIFKGGLDNAMLVERFIPVNNALANRIKIIDLATGVSGLPTLNTAAELVDLYNIDPAQPFKSVDQNYLVSTITGAKDLDNAGTYRNSNYSFSLLGVILAANAGTDYKTLLQDIILKPLKMEHSGIYTSDNMASGYDERTGKQMPYIEANAMIPSMGLRTNATDLVRFLAAEIEPSDTLPLMPAINYSQQVQYSKPEIQSSPGWEIKNDLYYMYGSTYGFSAVAGFNRVEKSGIVVMINNNDAALAKDVFDELYKVLIGKPAPKIKKPNAKPSEKPKKPIVKK